MLDVAKEYHLVSDWINNDVQIFARGKAGLRLYEESIEQDVLLWRGANLLVYAGSRKWSLQSKLKRYGMHHREVDLVDAVVIVKQLTEENGGPMDRQAIKGWNTTPSYPIQDWVLDELAQGYEEKYQVKGINPWIDFVTDVMMDVRESERSSWNVGWLCIEHVSCDVEELE
ncbi:MAG: hypothetical protein M1816_001886 [Peltula sp. TS41687]|nr:MAG: hypothetical protein M1816_001886 [Peltula sp. TS41687]